MAACLIGVVGVGAVRPNSVVIRPPWLRVQLEWLAWARSVPFCLMLIVIVIWYLMYTNCVSVNMLGLLISLIIVIVINTLSYCVWLVSYLWHLTNFMLTCFSIVFRYLKS